MKHVFLGASMMAAAAMIAACSGGSGGNGSGGSAGSDQSAKFSQTAEALQKKLGAPGEKAQMPPADDPDVKAFDVEAEKALTALGTPAMPVQGFDSYERLCGPAANITAAYVSAGLGPTDKGGLPMNDQAKVAKMTENANRYMGQMFVPLLYSAHCSAAHIPTIDKGLTSRDLSGNVSTKVRNGAYGQVMGLLQMSASSDVPPAQRRKVVDLLVRDAGNFAIAFPQAQRQEISGIIDQAAQASPDLKAQADRIKADIAKAPCGKLCSS